MAKKFRVTLKNGRIVGPFTSSQMGELYIKGHIDGSEKFQLFPAGDWVPLKRLPDLAKAILNSMTGSNENDTDDSSEGKTVINLSLAKLKEKEGKSQKEEPGEKTVTRTETAVTPKEAAKNRGKTGFKEFQFSKTDSDDAIPDYEELERKQQKAEKLKAEEEAEKRREQEEKAKELDKTRIVHTAKRDIKEIEATKIVNPQQLLEETEVTEEETVEVSEDEPEEEVEETPVEDAATEMLNIKEFLPELKSDVAKAEKEFAKEAKRASLEDEIAEDDDEEYYVDEEDEEEEEEGRKKKGMKPIVAIAILGIIAFLYLDDDKEKQKPIVPQLVQMSFPVAAEFMDEEKSKGAFAKAESLYRQNTYLAKLLAGIKYNESLSLKFVDNPAFPKIILTYSELLEHSLQKRKDGKVLFRLIKIAKSKILKDPNVATGTAWFYYNFGKYKTALNTIENYLRIGSKPDMKMFAYYLAILTKVGDKEKAERVFNQLKEVKRKPLEAYIHMARFKESVEQYDEAKAVILEAGKIFPKSATLQLEYCKYLFRDRDLPKYTLTLKSVRELEAGNSPILFAKYLEHMGILSAANQDIETAVTFFQKALNIHQSDELRSKLAALELGGSAATESLILESKIVEVLRKAEKAYDEKNWDVAFSYAIDAADMSPSYIPSQLFLSKVYTDRGYYDKAITKLQELREQYPLNNSINFYLINAYIESFKLGDAQKEINNISRSKFAVTAEYASLLGRFYKKKDQIALALRWLNESIQRNPLADDDYFRMAEIYLYLRKYKEGQVKLIEAIELDPDNVEYRSLYAKILYELKSADVAIGYLRDLLEKHKDHPKLLSDIAIYYYKSGQMKEFNRYKERIDNLPRKDLSFYKFLIEAAKTEGKTQEVIEYSKELINLNPGDISTRMFLGEYLYDMGNAKDALFEFERVKEGLASYPRVHYNLAKVYISLGNLEKAEENANEEIKNNPNSELGYYVLAEVYRTKEDWPQAVKSLETAVSKNSKSVDSLALLAWIRARQNDLTTARELYLRALRQDASNADLHKQLAFVYKQMGQSGLAIDEFDTYLKLKPNADDKDKIQKTIDSLR